MSQNQLQLYFMLTSHTVLVCVKGKRWRSGSCFGLLTKTIESLNPSSVKQFNVGSFCKASKFSLQTSQNVQRMSQFYCSLKLYIGRLFNGPACSVVVSEFVYCCNWTLFHVPKPPAFQTARYLILILITKAFVNSNVQHFAVYLQIFLIF